MVITGTIIFDPELRYTKREKHAICAFRIRLDDDSEIRCNAWERLAVRIVEEHADYKSGARVVINGHWRVIRQYSKSLERNIKMRVFTIREIKLESVNA